MTRSTSDPSVTLITGAASGIGCQLAADLLAAGGHRLVLCDLDRDGLEDAFGGTSAQLERLDVVCDVAGVLTPGWIWEVDGGQVDLHVDVKGVLYGSKAAAEKTVGQGAGHVVNVSSLAGVGYTPGNALYCTAKHAVRGSRCPSRAS